MIQKINERFVATTITYADLKERGKGQDAFAAEVAAHFVGPVEMMFFTPEGKFVSKLSVTKDLLDIHPDTDVRPGQHVDPSPERNVRTFMDHIEEHFGKAP